MQKFQLQRVRELTMPDYILLMHDDAVTDDRAWEPYLRRLRQSGLFQGGSAIGDGVCMRKNGKPVPITARLSGFIRVNAESLDQARSLVSGNPLFEAGGTVEIRE